MQFNNNLLLDAYHSNKNAINPVIPINVKKQPLKRIVLI